MKTNHPEVFDIEVDRDELGKIFATSYRRNVWLVFGFLLFAPVALRMAAAFDSVENFAPLLSFWLTMIFILGAGILLYMAVVWALGELLFQIHGKKTVGKHLAGYAVKVEGPFLRVINGKRDRKIHFRQIGDYEAILGNKRKPDVGAINMMMLSSGNGMAYLTLPAVANVIVMRDTLAEVDAARE